MARCLREYPALLRLRMALEAEIAAYRYAGRGAGGAGGARGSARACLLQGDAGGRRAALGLPGPAVTGPPAPLRDPAPGPPTSAPRGPLSPRSPAPRDLCPWMPGPWDPRTLWTPLDSWSPGPSCPPVPWPPQPGLLGPPATRAPQTPAPGGPGPPGGQRPRGRTLSPASLEQQRGWGPGPGPCRSTSIKPRGITRSRPVCGGGAASPGRALLGGTPLHSRGLRQSRGAGWLRGSLDAGAISLPPGRSPLPPGWEPHGDAEWGTMWGLDHGHVVEGLVPHWELSLPSAGGWSLSPPTGHVLP